MKVVIITGCFGYIGKNLANFLIKKDVYVYGVDIFKIDIFDEYSNFKYISYEELNLFDLNHEIDVLYHLAWKGVSSNEKNDSDAQFYNIKFTYNILNIAKKLNVKKIIIPGSISEFSEAESAVTGNEIDSPSDLYAATKVAIRKIAYQFCKKNDLDLNWLLITSVYGIGRKDANLLNYTITNLTNNLPVKCTPLEQKWDYIYIDDLINALYLISEKGEKNKLYPVGSGEIHKLKYYVECIAKELNKENLVKIGALPYKNNYIDNSIVDISGLKIIGFKVDKLFKENIKQIISSYIM